MQGLDANLIELVWQQLAVGAPTNPSSLTLAAIGIGTLLLFGIRGRSKLRDRAIGGEASQLATSAEKRHAA